MNDREEDNQEVKNLTHNLCTAVAGCLFLAIGVIYTVLYIFSI